MAKEKFIEVMDTEDVVYYTVHGTMTDADLDTEFTFDEQFDSAEKAKKYMRNFIEKYPKSELLLAKRQAKELELYA